MEAENRVSGVYSFEHLEDGMYEFCGDVGGEISVIAVYHADCGPR